MVKRIREAIKRILYTKYAPCISHTSSLRALACVLLDLAVLSQAPALACEQELVSSPIPDSTHASPSGFLFSHLPAASRQKLALRSQDTPLIPIVREAFQSGQGAFSLLAQADPATRASLLRISQFLYERGTITHGQFVTAVLQWEALVDLKSIAIKLDQVDLLDEASGNTLTPLALNLFFPDTDLPSRDRARTFETLLRRLPASERRMALLPVPDARIAGADVPWQRAFMGLHAVDHPPHMFWSRHYGSSIVGFATPSFGALQAYLIARFGEEAVILLPSFGNATQTDVLQGIITGGRIFGLLHPDLTGPSEQSLLADHEFYGHFLFSIHDFVHALDGSSAPRAYRQTLAQIVLRMLKRYQDRQGLFEVHAPSLIFPVVMNRESLDRHARQVSDLYFASNAFPNPKLKETLGRRLTLDFESETNMLAAAALEIVEDPALSPRLDPLADFPDAVRSFFPVGGEDIPPAH